MNSTRDDQRFQRANGPIALAFAAMLCAMPGASRAEDAPPSPDPDEVQRFCTNIADAARDRRYALQTERLTVLKKDIDERITALEKKRAEYEEWLARRDDFLDKAQDGVVAIYANMTPDAAAEKLAALNVNLAAAIVMKLEPRQAGVILNEMESDAAAKLTVIMASAARKVDPS